MWMSTPSQYVTSHPGQPFLAVPPLLGAVSTSKSWRVNRRTDSFHFTVAVDSRHLTASASALYVLYYCEHGGVDLMRLKPNP